jgi:hypothetical protein
LLAAIAIDENGHFALVPFITSNGNGFEPTYDDGIITAIYATEFDEISIEDNVAAVDQYGPIISTEEEIGSLVGFKIKENPT